MGFKFDFFLTVFPEVLPYLKTTLFIAFSSYFFSLILGVGIAVCRTFNNKGINKLFEVYISFFRSTPLVTQLFFIYFGLPQVIPAMAKINDVTILIIVMSINQAAFMAEIIRGAFMSIPKGQYSAAKSIGMSNRETFQHIILPQVFRIAVPGLVNSMIGSIKGTSIGYTIGVLEMLTASKLYSARTYRHVEVYVAILLIYWAIVLVVTKIQSTLEKRLNRGYV